MGSFDVFLQVFSLVLPLNPILNLKKKIPHGVFSCGGRHIIDFCLGPSGPLVGFSYLLTLFKGFFKCVSLSLRNHATFSCLVCNSTYSLTDPISLLQSSSNYDLSH